MNVLILFLFNASFSNWVLVDMCDKSEVGYLFTWFELRSSKPSAIILRGYLLLLIYDLLL